MNQFLANHRTFLSRIFSILVIIPIVLFTPKINLNELLSQITIAIGLILVLLGVLGRIFSSIFMGNNRNKNLVTYGMYSITRNPLYFFSFIASLGLTVLYGSIIVCITMIVLYFTYYKFVISYEEHNLKNIFGESYKSYINKVPRFFPNFSLWYSNEDIMVSYKVVLKTILDTGIFFLAAIAILILLELKESGNFISLYYIY